MLHHKISKEFHFGYFSESSQDILDFFTVSSFYKMNFLNKISDTKIFLKVSDEWNKVKLFL